MKNIEVGSIVWVNEMTIDGKQLPKEWYGKVVSLENPMRVQVKDIMPKSNYKGEIFSRWINNLELKE